MVGEVGVFYVYVFIFRTLFKYYVVCMLLQNLCKQLHALTYFVHSGLPFQLYISTLEQFAHSVSTHSTKEIHISTLGSQLRDHFGWPLQHGDEVSVSHAACRPEKQLHGHVLVSSRR